MLADYSRANLLGRIGIAHAAGLWVAGMIGTIQSDSGFDMLGGAFAGALGGLFFIPWIAALVLLACFRPTWIGQHTVLFAVVGPVLVCGSWALFAGNAFLDDVAISSVTSSVVWLAMAFATPVWRGLVAKPNRPRSRSVR
jgi:hypothetical protein